MNFKTPTNRPIELAKYILASRSTIRQTAQVFGVPKSTVHHDLSIKLKQLNPALYLQVQKLMQQNFSIKHFHGGEATRKKYLALKNEININDQQEYLNSI